MIRRLWITRNKAGARYTVPGLRPFARQYAAWTTKPMLCDDGCWATETEAEITAVNGLEALACGLQPGTCKSVRVRIEVVR